MANSAGAVIETPWRPSHNPWLIAVAVALACFIEILDTAIAIVALPHIAGDLGAGMSETNWVMTSYLVANAIVLPISGFLSTSMGRKKYLLACVAGFTVASLLCGLAPTLSLLITFRVLQGLLGGGLQPVSQAILADSFPQEKHGQAFAIFGLTAVVAPIVAPMLGGWITDNFSWRWIFYIKVPVGIIALIMQYQLVEDPPYIVKMKSIKQHIDYIGISLLSLGIASLQVMLDKGQEDDWLGSHFIVTLLVICVVSLVAFIIYELRHKAPVIDLRLFKNRNYSLVCLMMLFVGIVLYSSSLSLPQYLQMLLGYTAQLAGVVLTPAGLVATIFLPIVGLMCSKIPVKWLILFGWLTTGLSMFYTTAIISTEMDFWSAVMVRAYQSIGPTFLLVSLTVAAYFGIPKEESNQISGTINLMRNLGGSIGISLMGAVVERRAQLHRNNLVVHATTYDPILRHMAQGVAMHFHMMGNSLTTGRMMAIATIWNAISAQAVTLAFIDLFWILGVVSLVFVVLSFLIPRNEPQGSGALPLH